MWAAGLDAGAYQHIAICNPSLDTLSILQDKRRFAQLNVELGVPHPRFYQVSSAEELARIPFESMERAFFKPSQSRDFLARFGAKGLWIANRDEAFRLWKEIEDEGFDVLVQEYIAGGANDHYFVDGFRDRHGEVRALLARRRDRIWPLDFGNSSYCRDIDPAAVAPARDSLEKILEATNYRGIFSGEFKQDANSGEFKIIEVNTRTWIYVDFATHCGVNVCELAYRDALGDDMATVTVEEHGKSCVSLYEDLFSVMRTPKEHRPAAITVLGQWLRSYKPVFDWRDPWPGLYTFLSLASDKLRRMAGRQ